MNDGILRLHTPENNNPDHHTNYWMDRQANKTVLTAGHTYRFGVYLRLADRDGETSRYAAASVGGGAFGWYGHGLNVTHDWQTLTGTFTAVKGAPAASIADCIFTLSGTPETWLEALGMVLSDMTDGTPQCLDVDWYNSDGHEYAINGASIFKK